MEKIDRNNYETFFIDYLDGSLPVGKIDLLLDFLNENPDLAEELKGLEKIKLQPASQTPNNFNQLKKSDLDLAEIFEETCVRAVENDLSRQEMELFQHHLSQNKEHRYEYKLFQSTISEPDPFILFENKQHLKKKGKVLLPYIGFAAAAVIVLGLFLILPDKKQQKGTTEVQVAEVSKPDFSNKVEPGKDIHVEKTAVKIKPSIQILLQQENEIMNSEVVRIVEKVEPMNSLAVTVSPVVSDDVEMALIPIDSRLTIKPPTYSKHLTPEEYLASKVDEVKEKGALGKFVLRSLNKISGERFEYSTTEKGKVEKLEYNSKFLAFTIPVPTH